MTPKPFGSKEEHWREWVDEIRDYMDLIKPGMKRILTLAEKARDDETVDEKWALSQDPALGAEADLVWRALKQLTEAHSEARQVVTSVPDEDGYAAWVKLHRRFGMALSMRQGTMPASFSHLGQVKMKTSGNPVKSDRNRPSGQTNPGDHRRSNRGWSLEIGLCGYARPFDPPAHL